MPWRRCSELLVRLDRLEQRVADIEDVADPATEADLVDDLAHQVAELTLLAPTQEDLLDLRLATARVATDLARLAAELAAGIDRLSSATEDELDAAHARITSLGEAVSDLLDQHQRPHRSATAGPAIRLASAAPDGPPRRLQQG